MNDDTLEIKLTKDLKATLHTMNREQARHLVDTYYQHQENRKRADGQIRSVEKTEEPHAVLDWLSERESKLEGCIKLALKCYAQSQHMGRWAMSQVGVGPVIAAGLIAHIDITKAPTAGHIWSFAGMNPNQVWEKGQKRPFNARLKQVAFFLGECFVKTSNKPDGFYGHLYKERKAREAQYNEDGKFAAQAAAVLESKRIGKTTEAYKWYSAGKLPPAHIHARARRYAAKIFLAHWQAEAYREHYGKEPPLPYPIAHQGHTHVIESPAA